MTYAGHNKDMTTTQITAGTRTYTFTTEGFEDRKALRTLGSLFNSRGQFFGYVVEYAATGRRSVITTSRVSRDMMRAVQAL